jgi:hypothetical protein
MPLAMATFYRKAALGPKPVSAIGPQGTFERPGKPPHDDAKKSP